MRYFVSSPKNHAESRKNWSAARKEKKCLLLTPPVKAEELTSLLAHFPSEPPKGAVLAVLTSGTTGNPKPVFHTLASLRASKAQVARWLKKEKVLSTLSPWSMAGFLFGVLLKADALSDNPLFAAGEFIERAKAKKFSRLITHPYHLQILTELGVWRETKGSKLKITSFTAPLPDALVKHIESFGIRLETGYGMSEAAGPVLVGGKSLGAKCKIAKDGQLFIEGPQLMLGAERPFPTGDIFAKVRGRLEWRGRIRELIDVGGRKIAPNWIEELVGKFKGVKECFAYGVPDDIYGQRVAILVEGNSIDRDEFQKYLEKTFSPDLLPREWNVLPKFPRLASGKKDKRRLKEVF